MVGAFRLPLHFDPALLLQDVREIEKQARWIDHWGAAPGEWGVIALISADGSPESIHCNGGDPGKPTPLLAKATHLQAAIGAFRAPILHARLSRLRPHASIRPHRDFGYASDRRWSFERGFIRVHVPILTDERVQWRLADDRIDMRPGEAWYLNVCLRHSVENPTDDDRVHLVLELQVNQWLRRLFPPETLWDKLRGMAIRRLEPPMWKLAKPLVGRPRRRSTDVTRSTSTILVAARDEIPSPERKNGVE